jgi:hypothetical protein
VQRAAADLRDEVVGDLLIALTHLGAV